MMFLRGYRSFGSCFGLGRGIYGGGWLIFLIMALLTIAAVILIIKRINNSSRKNAYDASLEELKIEFAKGNLTEEEYIRRKKILND